MSSTSSFKTGFFVAVLAVASQAGATGLANCGSGPREAWQPSAKLEQQLKTWRRR